MYQMEQTNERLLSQITYPEDLRRLKVESLPEVCQELREDIVKELSVNPGHLASSLGVVELTVALKNEGMARELINRIQNIRKESGFEITDRINIILAPNAEVEKAVDSFSDYIKTQVLANDIKVEPNDGQEVEFDDFKLNIKVVKQ